jgi:hypothetical protein
MRDVQNSQGAAAKAPPIPTMDVNPAPPATTGREIAREVRDRVKQARLAAQDAKTGTATPAIVGTDAGHTATTAPAPGYDSNNIIPPQAVDISLAFFLMIAFCVVGFPLARAFARRMDRKTEFKSVAGPDLTPQIRQLQESVDAMAIEMERISEGQRFTAKLLADRSGVGAQNK